MAKLSCCLLSILLVLAMLDVTSASRSSCGKGLRGRSGACRNVLSMFKRLLQDMDEDEQGDADEERGLPLDNQRDEEADLQALLYGQVPDDDPMDTDERMPAGDGKEDPSAYKQNLKMRRYELEMDLVEELLRDLETFNNDDTRK